MVKMLICLLAIVVLVGCGDVISNPFAPTPYKTIHSLKISPNGAVNIPLGSEQLFTLSLRHGNLADVRMGMLGAKYYDGECPCERRKKLGKLKRLNDESLLYIAPTSVKSVALPATIEIFGCTGEVGVNSSCSETLAEVTISAP